MPTITRRPLTDFVMKDGVHPRLLVPYEATITLGDCDIEDAHDLIQWQFPLREPSKAQPSAPYLGVIDVLALKASALGPHRVRFAAMRYLNFYSNNHHWNKPDDHNYLRISRITRSLRLVGLESEARDFLHTTYSLATKRNPGAITDVTKAHWTQALIGPI